MDGDLGSGKSAPIGDPGGNRGERLHRLEGTGLGVEVEHRHGEIELVDAVGMATIGMEGEVPRAGACSHGGRPVGPNRCLPGIESVDEDLVDAEVADDGKAAVRGGVDRMPVGTLLAGGIDALSLVLDEPCRSPRHRRPEPTIGLDSEAHRAPAAVVGRQHCLA